MSDYDLLDRFHYTLLKHNAAITPDYFGARVSHCGKFWFVRHNADGLYIGQIDARGRYIGVSNKYDDPEVAANFILNFK